MEIPEKIKHIRQKPLLSQENHAKDVNEVFPMMEYRVNWEAKPDYRKQKSLHISRKKSMRSDLIA